MSLNLLTTADFHRYKHFFEHQRYPICAYSLPSIIVWHNDEYHPLATVYDDMLVIGTEFRRHREKRHLILPVSPEKEASPETLHELAVAFDFKRYWFVPEEYITRFGRERIEAGFSIVPHPEYDDYNYLQDDLAHLKGNKFSKKRNLVNQFQRKYEATGRVRVDTATAADADECAEFIEAWCLERQCDGDDQNDLACEKLAALNAIWHMDELEIHALVLRIDAEVCAFAVGSYLTDDMGVLHFEKAFSRIKGLYQYFDRQCARQMFDGYRYINKESDMGEPNLAKAKKSYQPVAMIRSYQLVLRD